MATGPTAQVLEWSSRVLDGAEWDRCWRHGRRHQAGPRSPVTADCLGYFPAGWAIPDAVAVVGCRWAGEWVVHLRSWDQSDQVAGVLLASMRCEALVS